MHTYATVELVRERQERMIEDARLHRLMRVQRNARLVAAVGRARHALSSRRVEATVSGRPEPAACPC